jgi:hypothetical protein
MIDKKYYLIKLTYNNDAYWLRKGGRIFKWTNHGKDQEYKSLTTAIKKAEKLSFSPSTGSKDVLEVIEVTYKPCNSKLPDGFYAVVYNSVYRVNGDAFSL